MPTVDRIPRAGSFRHVVTIQPVGTTTTAENSVIENLGSQITRRCKIEPLSGRERAEARQVHGEAEWKVTMRYQDVRPDDRLLWSDKYNSLTRTLLVLWTENVHADGRKMVVYCRENISA